MLGTQRRQPPTDPNANFGDLVDDDRAVTRAYAGLVDALIRAWQVGLIGSWLAECVCRELDRSVYGIEHPDVPWAVRPGMVQQEAGQQ